MKQPVDTRVSKPELRLDELSDGRSARVWLDLDLDGVGFSFCLMSQPTDIAKEFITGGIVFSNNGLLTRKT